jgi:5-hydroxyisourate hydrolase-like protein (transthyretin family)
MRTTLIALVMCSTASVAGAQPYSQFLLHTRTPLGLIEDGRGDFTMADIDRDGRQDLVFIKRRDVGTGRIEVHAFSAASNFQQAILHSGSALFAGEDGNGDFTMADVDRDGRPDLVFIKRRATPTGKIELHVASAASGFQQFIQHVATALPSTEDNSGDFQVSDTDRDGRPDLVFIKRRATATGRIEVHVLSAASGFQQFSVHTATAFLGVEDGNGAFSLSDGDNDGRPDLVFFKHQQTGTTTVEVHAASGASAFQQFLQHARSALIATEGAFGDFTMVDHDRDGRLDMVFIKRRKTATGTIEMHILRG